VVFWIIKSCNLFSSGIILSYNSHHLSFRPFRVTAVGAAFAAIPICHETGFKRFSSTNCR